MRRVVKSRGLVSLGVVLICVVASLSVWAATRGVARASAAGCFPGPPTSLRRWQHLEWNDIHSYRGMIDSVEGSSAQPGRVYVSTSGRGLYVGGGHPFRWRHVVVAAPDIVLAVGAQHDVLYGEAWGLFRSVDEGRHWTPVSCDYGGGDFAVSPSDPSSLYQLGNPGDWPLNKLGGYYRSRDGGKTWSRSTVGKTEYDGPELNAVAVNPTNPEDVTIALYGGGIERTVNGSDWTYTRLPGPSRPWDGQQVENLAYGAGPNGVLWAGTTSGVFVRGADGAWVQAGLAGHGVTVYPDARVAPDALALLGFNGMGRACVRRTTDSGKTWFPVRGLRCDIRGIRVSPADDTAYAWTLHMLYRSTDHGATWTGLPPLRVG